MKIARASRVAAPFVLVVCIFAAAATQAQIGPANPTIISCKGVTGVTYAAKPDYPTLKDAAQDDDLIIGTGFAGSLLPDAALPEGSRSQLTAEQFARVTPENDMKWENTERIHNVFTFCDAERIVQFAAANGMKVHGHVLVWHQQLPAWITGISDPVAANSPLHPQAELVVGTANGALFNYTAQQWRDILTNHVYTESHYFDVNYPGVVDSWDVVGEPLDDPFWENKTQLGRAGYIRLALKAAHAGAPNAKLFIDEYSLESADPASTPPGTGYENRRQTMLDLLDQVLLEKDTSGTPLLNGLNIQTHLKATFQRRDADKFKDFMDAVAAKGLIVHLDQMDIESGASGSTCIHQGIDTCQGEYQTAVQIEQYRAVLDACLKVPACKAITVWGFEDSASWKHETDPTMRNRFGWKDVWTEWINALYESHRCVPQPACVRPNQRHIGLVKSSVIDNKGQGFSYGITNDRQLVSEIHRCGNNVSIGALQVDYMGFDTASSVSLNQDCATSATTQVNSIEVKDLNPSFNALTYAGGDAPLFAMNADILHQPVAPLGSSQDYWVWLRGQVDGTDRHALRPGVRFMAFTPTTTTPRVGSMTMEIACSGIEDGQCGLLPNLVGGPRSVPLVKAGSFVVPGRGIYESYALPVFVEGLSKLSVTAAAPGQFPAAVYVMPWLPLTTSQPQLPPP